MWGGRDAFPGLEPADRLSKGASMGRCKHLVLAVAMALCFSASLYAQEEVFEVEPAQSHVAFTLGDIFHTVHGTFQLKTGAIRFDPATGAASGQLVVDAASGNSGSNARD